MASLHNYEEIFYQPGPAAAGLSINKKNNKLRAASFPGVVLRIGSWELRSSYKCELVGKFYFGKCKLVWELIVGDVMRNMEMKWSDITGLQKGVAALTITLARKPPFFQEIDPKPRKPIQWQSTADFTGGQATIHNTHYIECSPGVLDKHYENLIRCDTRLAVLSRQPAAVVGYPYFDGYEYFNNDQQVEAASVSMSDLFDLCNQNPISAEQITSLLSAEVVTDQWLDKMSQVLLNDSTKCTTDETSIMKKVNSISCCLMEEGYEPAAADGGGCDIIVEQEANSMPRIDSLDSLEHLLLNLPRVASLPMLLYGV